MGFLGQFSEEPSSQAFFHNPGLRRKKNTDFKRVVGCLFQGSASDRPVDLVFRSIFSDPANKGKRLDSIQVGSGEVADKGIVRDVTGRAHARGLEGMVPRLYQTGR